jgi:hypothetical protein
MIRFRFCGPTLLALTLLVLPGRADEPKSSKAVAGYTEPLIYPLQGKSKEAKAPKQETSPVCRIYSLAELGDDANLGKWIAETIPEVIEPESWSRAGSSGKKPVLRHYGPKQILVIYHTPAVQTRVEEFLKNVQKALPRGKDKAAAGKPSGKDSGVIPAKYPAPGLIPTSNVLSGERFNYPVPPPAGQPKHLFHFIIRYEGAGIIDSNVVKFMKLQTEQKESTGSEANPKAPNEPKGSGADPLLTPPPPPGEKNNPPPAPGEKKVKEEKKEKGSALTTPTTGYLPSLAPLVKTEKENNKEKQDKQP